MSDIMKERQNKENEMSEISHEDKLNEIVNYFRANKEDLLVMDWSDGQSTEYGFANMTFIEVHEDLGARQKAYSVLSDFNGDEIFTIVDGVKQTIEHADEEQLAKLDEVYEDFVDEKPTVKQKKKSTRRRTMR